MNFAMTRLRTAAALLSLAGISLNTAPAQSGPQPSRLFIQILDGEGALNDIRSRTAREPIIEIQDENHRPIAGAVVLFSTPDSGPGAVFENGLNSYKAVTGEDGRVTLHGLRPNSTSGAFQIQVSATLGALSSVAVINQTNVGRSSVQTHAGHGLMLKVLIAVGGAAGAGAVAGFLLTRGSHSDTVTAGAPAVGAP